MNQTQQQQERHHKTHINKKSTTKKQQKTTTITSMSFYYSDSSASAFLLTGMVFLKAPLHASQASSIRRFRANFGVSPIVCEKLWNLLIEFEDVEVASRCTPTHLLYALLFLKMYGTEGQLKSIHNKDEKHF